MFTPSLKEPAIQKNLAPKTGLARVNERQEHFGRSALCARLVGLDDLNCLMNAALNIILHQL